MTNLFQQPCEFIAGAATIDSLPPMGAPEVALIGRSNVGKSSLVNALTGRKTLARTSQNPGATKQLNFFALGDNRLVLVDMPGYGYASVSKQKRGEWDDLIERYLAGRANLKRVCVLIDARRGIMPPDVSCMELLDEAAVNYQIVLTKIDTLKPSEVKEVLLSVQNGISSHPAAHPSVLTTSSVNKNGIDALQAELAAFALEKKI